EAEVVLLVLPPFDVHSQVGVYVGHSLAQVVDVLSGEGLGGREHQSADPAAADRFRSLIAALDGVHEATIEAASEATTVTARAADGRATLARAITAARDAGIAVTAADTKLPTLDDVFLTLTGRSLRDTGELAA